MTVERAARNTGWLFGAYVVRSAVRLGYIVSFGRLLKEEGLGSYYFLLTLAAILTIFSALGLSIFLVRGLNRKGRDPVAFISRCFGLRLTSSVLVALGLLAVAPFTPYGHDVRLGMFIMGLAVVPLSMIALLHSVSVAYEKLWIFAVLENVTPLFEAAVGLTLLLNGFGLVALCTLRLVVYSLYAVVFFVLVQRHIVGFRLRFDLRAWRGYVGESWKIWVFAMQAVLYAHLGVVILSGISGNAQVGFFAAAMALVEIIRQASNALRSAVFPYMVRAWDRSADELKGFHQSCVRLIAVAAVPTGLLGILLARPVLTLLFGQRYLASVPVLQILAWSVFPLFFEQIMVRVCYASGHSMLPIFGHGIINVLRIALSVAFVVSFGEQAPVGLAWALLASGCAGFVVYTLLIRRYIYRFAPVGTLLRTACASAAPVVVVVLLQDRVNAFVLAAAVLALFAAGVYLFRVFTAKELEILRRAISSFGGRKPVADAAVEPEEPDAAQS